MADRELLAVFCWVFVLESVWKQSRNAAKRTRASRKH